MSTVLVTGSNRGLGRALATRFLLQANTTVIAAVRIPEELSSQSLTNLPRGEGAKLILVKIDSGSDTDAQEAIKYIQTDHGIEKLDVVVANAGYGTVYGNLSEVKPQEVRDLVDINAIGPLRLFQAVRALLEAGNRPRFVVIGSPIGSITEMNNPEANFPMFAYGTSKAAAHYLTRKIHYESPGLVAFVVDPGFVQTDMGNTGARHFGLDQAFVPIDVAADFVFEQIGKATRDDTSGKFVTNYEDRETYQCTAGQENSFTAPFRSAHGIRQLHKKLIHHANRHGHVSLRRAG